jgi:hypothetical protein
MYNLTVAGVHTYYVLAGYTPVLVHNSCGISDHVDGCYCDLGDVPKLRVCRLAVSRRA